MPETMPQLNNVSYLPARAPLPFLATHFCPDTYWKTDQATSEQRRHDRHDVDCPVLFRGGTLPLKHARARDLSLRGMFIESDEHPAEGELVQLRLHHSATGRELGLRARVVRAIPGRGMAVHFESCDNPLHLFTWCTSRA